MWRAIYSPGMENWILENLRPEEENWILDNWILGNVRPEEENQNVRKKSGYAGMKFSQARILGLLGNVPGNLTF